MIILENRFPAPGWHRDGSRWSEPEPPRASARLRRPRSAARGQLAARGRPDHGRRDTAVTSDHWHDNSYNNSSAGAVTGGGHSAPAGEHRLEEVCLPPASETLTLSTIGWDIFSSSSHMVESWAPRLFYSRKLCHKCCFVVVVVNNLHIIIGCHILHTF